ncbi:hypothetical protein BEST7613_5539 [Synechocystis sp. PCC 6803]|nr:hypothetical protein BEST7613_5539 [Synechocystis sp. PCC 6803] [Bacillus subtilis BEST7613]
MAGIAPEFSLMIFVAVLSSVTIELSLETASRLTEILSSLNLDSRYKNASKQLIFYVI